MNIQAMINAYKNRYDSHKEERPGWELEEIIQKQTKIFWDNENKKLLEKQKDYSPNAGISSKAVVLKLRKEIRNLAHENNQDCSFVSLTDRYQISLLPSRITIYIETQTGNFTVFAPNIPKRSFVFYEWQMGLNWIQDYLNIDVQILEQKKQELKEKLYVNSKTAEIAQASIKSICNAQAKQKGFKCRIISTWLKSEVLFYNEDEIKFFDFTIYYKEFTNNPSRLMDLLNNINETEYDM